MGASAQDLPVLMPVIAADGATVSVVSSTVEAEAVLATRATHLLILDAQSEYLDWLEALDQVDDLNIAVLVDADTLELAKFSQRVGVEERLVRPLQPEPLAAFFEAAVDDWQEVDPENPENHSLLECGRMYGASEPMRRLFRLIKKVAPTTASVLLVGESGTGKELAAEAIHQASNVSDGPYIAVNCGAIPAELMESELFGHEKGSFTGAHKERAGYFEQAAGGSLFLDEVTEMAPELQVKLLRVLENGEFRRLGGDQTLTANVRIIASTNRRPKVAVQEGFLREDLYYRIAEFPLKVPSLRTRGRDAVFLAQRFLAEHNQTTSAAGTDQLSFSQPALDAIMLRDWPGNVRELKNAVKQACIVADGEIGERDLPESHLPNSPVDSDYVQVSVGTTLERAERDLIVATMEKFDGDKTKAADALGVSVRTVYNKMKDYDGPDESADPS